MKPVNKSRLRQERVNTRHMRTLEQFIIERQLEIPQTTGEFSRLLRDIALAAKIVNRDMRRAGLVDIFGETGVINVQGETQKTLDALAHQEFLRALRRGGECCLIGSEEHAEAIPIDESANGAPGKYIVLLDPLDGSTNIEVNVSVGTIFSVYRMKDGPEKASLAHALQPGTEQVAAGYVIYGSSTMLVYTTGNGVNGFTLDPSIGEFLLSHPDIRTPESGSIYSINEGNAASWDEALKHYITWVKQEDEATNRPYIARYIGSFVADFHRNLLQGGVYIYPANSQNPRGKLRLMYEANPMGFIVEQAGGLATDGVHRIMEIQPEALHQRIPVFIGSRSMVQQVESFLKREQDRT